MTIPVSVFAGYRICSLPPVSTNIRAFIIDAVHKGTISTFAAGDMIDVSSKNSILTGNTDKEVHIAFIKSFMIICNTVSYFMFFVIKGANTAIPKVPETESRKPASNIA